MKKAIINNKKFVMKDSVIVELFDNAHNRWKIYKPIKIIALNKYFIIPQGFITDFASVPKILKIFIPYKYIYNQIVVLHDYLYLTHKVTREEADYILYEGIKFIGNNNILSRIIAKLFYYSVRFFGKSHWKSIKQL